MLMPLFYTHLFDKYVHASVPVAPLPKELALISSRLCCAGAEEDRENDKLVQRTEALNKKLPFWRNKKVRPSV